MEQQIHNSFAQLFPFYFSIDKNWKITEAGPSFIKHFPKAIGTSFDTQFSIITPKTKKKNLEKAAILGTLVILQKKNASLIFHGQFIAINESLYYCGSPKIERKSDLEKSNISISDFAPADNTIEVLEYIQNQEKSSKERNEIAKQYNKNHNELVLANQKLQKLIHSSNELIFEVNSECIFTDAWVESDKDLFVPKENFIGKHVSVVFPDEFGVNIQKLIKQVLTSKEVIELEYKNPAGDDWYNAKIKYFNFNDEESVTLSVRNITEQKKQQTNLETSNARLTALISNLTDGVLLENENREIVLVNTAFCNLFSIPVQPELLIGADCSDSASQSAPLFKNPEQFISRISEIIKNKELVIDEEIEMVSGKILIRNFIPVYNNNIYLGHLWKYSDITERTKYLQTLKITKEKYESIIENMGLGFLEVDNKDTILGTNKRMLEILGYQEESELLNQIASKILIPSKSEKAIQKEISNRKKGKTRVYEIFMKRKDGTLLPVLISGAPLYDTEKNIVGSVGIHLDMTKQKEIESQLKEQTELALKSVEAKQAFLANMSHEIRTPLNAIASSAALLENLNKSENEIDYINIIRFASASLSIIVNDILDLAKIENRKMELEKRLFNFSALMKGIFAQHKLMAQMKNISVILDIAPDIPDELIGDSFRLSQVINNLVSNAIKFTEKGEIAIRVCISELRTEKIDIYFEVDDSGVGMDKNFIKTIFEPFSQEDTSINRKHEGSGLGLSISKQLVELMGGKLFVESKKMKGSKFYFILPFQISEQRIVPAVVKTNINKTSMESARIVLADDNHLNQILTKQILNKHVREVICFDRAKGAIDYLKDNKTDLILMDLQMPEMDGIKATKIIRSEISLTIPIIGFSANAFSAHINKALNAGMNDYVSKPFEIDSLLEKIFFQLSNVNTLDYYNRINLLKQVGGDEELEKMIGKSFIVNIEDKWQNLMESFINKNHKVFLAILHEITPTIQMFVSKKHIASFNDIIEKSNNNFSSLELVELNSFQNTIKTVILELKPFVK